MWNTLIVALLAERGVKRDCRARDAFSLLGAIEPIIYLLLHFYCLLAKGKGISVPIRFGDVQRPVSHRTAYGLATPL